MSNSTIKIEHINNEMHRPSGYWTKQVHKFLTFLRKEGFNQAPEPLGFDEHGREIVSFMPGKTSDYPLSDEAKSITALISTAQLLRKLHDASQRFLNEDTESNQGWMFTAKNPTEVVCHNDFAPYNICFDKERAVGIIDFDTACPGPRTWDIVYALYRFAPFTSPENIDGWGTIEAQITRARLFCEAYGLAIIDRNGLTDLMIERLEALVAFLIQSAKSYASTKAPSNVLNSNAQRLTNVIEEYLGKDFKMIKNKSGDPVFINADNSRRIRFDSKNPHGDVPHGHVEHYDKISHDWIDYTDKHRIYLRDAMEYLNKPKMGKE